MRRKRYALLRERPAGWFADYDQFLLAALGRAIDEGVKSQGSNIARWDYGQMLELTIPNPIARAMGPKW